VIPHSELRQPLDQTSDSKVTKIVGPSLGNAVWVHVVMVQPGSIFLIGEGHEELARFDLGMGNQAVLFAEHADWSAHADGIARDKAKGLAKTDPATLARFRQPRMALFVTQDDGTRLIVDAALP